MENNTELINKTLKEELNASQNQRSFFKGVDIKKGDFIDSNDVTVNKDHLTEEPNGLWANIRAKRERGEQPAKSGDKDYPEKKQWDKLTKEDTEHNNESKNYMFWQNLKTIHENCIKLLAMDKDSVDSIIANGHAWAVDHISTSSDDINEVYDFFQANGETEGGYEDEYGNVENVSLNENEYKGKKVELNKPMPGDVKKFKVFVKNKKGNVIKINFGDPNMEIKRDDPKRKKAFRARFNCPDAKDRTTPKYWSCKMWSNTPVSEILGKK